MKVDTLVATWLSIVVALSFGMDSNEIWDSESF